MKKSLWQRKARSARAAVGISGSFLKLRVIGVSLPALAFIRLIVYICQMDIEFNKNEDVMKRSVSLLRQRLGQVYLGGGKKAIEKQRERKKLTPRERIAYLRDQDKP